VTKFFDTPVLMNSNRFQSTLPEEILVSLARYRKTVKGDVKTGPAFGKQPTKSEELSANTLWGYAENEVPQPQVPLALGLLNLKPPP
jgi:hypothetical protein